MSDPIAFVVQLFGVGLVFGAIATVLVAGLARR